MIEHSQKNNSGWNMDWFGPLRIPKKGDVISVNQDNIESWKIFIEREGHSVTSNNNGAVLIDGKTSTQYQAERDYLWMMGDNRDNSEDSRCWGFCPRENVIGKSMFVYWSMYNPPKDNGDNYDDEEAQDFHIRWSRLFKGAQ